MSLIPPQSETKAQYEKRLRTNHAEMRRTGVTKLPYPEFRKRQDYRNDVQAKEAFNERKIKL